MLSLYMSIDVEFNADSEYVHDYEVYFISKGLFGQKPCFWDSFQGFQGFWPNQAGYGRIKNRFRISVKN